MNRSVSAVIPAYNRRRQLLEAVQSVLQQTSPVDELIVVDDGSEDDLSDVQKLVEQSGHTWLRQDNRGPAAARNLGAAHAGGAFLAFLDSDDRWLPEKIEKQLDYFERYETRRACQCNERWFRRGVRVNPKKFHRMPDGEAFFASLERCVVSASAVMLRRSLFEELGVFDERLRVCEDYDYWLRLAAKFPIGLIGEELVEKFGGHADQLSRSQPVMDRFRVFSIVKLIREQPLSEKKYAAAAAELERKSRIVAAGAARRETAYEALFADLAAECSVAAGLGQEPFAARLGEFWEELLEVIAV